MLWKEWLKRDVSNFRKKKRQENMALIINTRIVFIYASSKLLSLSSAFSNSLLNTPSSLGLNLTL
jgi:hypothetical protein